MSKPIAWRNRIVGHEEVDPTTLKKHNLNWRLHPEPQRRALAKVFDKIGWVQNVVVNRLSGNVLDGHARIDLAVVRGEKVPVTWVELTEQEERTVLATFDSISAMAVTDEQKLGSLVQQIDVEALEMGDFFHQLSNAPLAEESSEDEAEPEQASGERKERTGGDPQRMIKPVLYAPELKTFEQALRLTGERNRGAALIMICRSYIDQVLAEQENAEGQHDLSLEGQPA